MSFSVSIIGSFRQNYDAVIQVAEEFESLGVTVSSPAVSRIINPGAGFVRFETDSPWLPDQLIQAAALRRILSSDLVYVVAPGGYVGITTCYELGRVQECRIPTYFSAAPRDLPIAVPPESVVGVRDLVRRVGREPARPAAAAPQGRLTRGGGRWRRGSCRSGHPVRPGSSGR